MTESKKAVPDGYRLERLELYNWGTFHNRIWAVVPNGENTLLTGENGSGKSTAADALLALLSPTRSPHYNEAAGAAAGERSIYTYVAGYYKKTGIGDETQYKCLRPANTYTVILAVFADKSRDSCVTLARVLYLEANSVKSVGGFCVIANEKLSIKDHFSSFGSDIKSLKKRLAKSYKLFTSYNAYVEEFKRELGIFSTQALDLFCEAVGTKQVPNLSTFVKEHMIPPQDFNAKAQNILEQFHDLTSIYEQMQKAREQIDELKPITEAGAQYDELIKTLELCNKCREAVHVFLARYWAEIIKDRLDEVTEEKRQIEAELDITTGIIRTCESQISKFLDAIYESGGGRLESIARDLADLRDRMAQLKRSREVFGVFASQLGEKIPETISEFTRLGVKLNKQKSKYEQEKDDLEDSRSILDAPYFKLDEKFQDLKREYASLEKRSSNLPDEQIRIRELLCRGLNLKESDLPFAGELIEVQDKFKKKWQGAIERVLRNFALSILVKPENYDDMVLYVNSHNLRGRIVYYRVDEVKQRTAGLDPNALIKRIKIKDDDPEFHDFVFFSILNRFNYVCTDDLRDFKRLSLALTSSGQMKSPGGRHEKDDRHDINDLTRYVLGWSNAEKKESLKQLIIKTNAELEEINRRRRDAKAQLANMENNLRAIDRLLEMEFSQIDLSPLTKQIDDLERQRVEIEHSSKGQTLEQLKRQKEIAERERDNSLASQRRLDGRLGSCNEKYTQLTRELELARQVASEKEIVLETELQLNEFFSAFKEKRQPILEKRFDFDDGFNKFVDSRRDEVREKSKELSDRIISRATSFANAFPEDTRDCDPSNVNVHAELKNMLSKLENDDLPRFLDSFKRKLRDNTIFNIGSLSASLAEERKSIIEHIKTINLSLGQLDYNPGTYIQIKPIASNDGDVRQFREDLKNCTSLMINDNEFDELQAEEKFLQIKELLDRFEGRKDHLSEDRLWRQKVLDVRNWLVFGAEELYRFDNQEKEFFDGSDGKSGGQKEKLAYTILAAAIAYQYRLSLQDGGRSFRFVMIDEAFCRGSDDTARHTLSIFKLLDLQVMVITPLLKLNVIEQFVKTVAYAQAFIDPRNGGLELSALQNMSVEEYAKDKSSYLERRAREEEKRPKAKGTRRRKEPDPVQGNLFANLSPEDHPEENEDREYYLDEKQNVFDEED